MLVPPRADRGVGARTSYDVFNRMDNAGAQPQRAYLSVHVVPCFGWVQYCNAIYFVVCVYVYQVHVVLFVVVVAEEHTLLC